MKIEVGTKFEVVETAILERANYIKGEVYVIISQEDMSDGINFSTSEVEGDKSWLNLVEVLQHAFEEGKFKIVGEGKEMEQQNEFGLVAGDKVKCITDGMDYYDSGVVYTIGKDSWGDFGVLDEDSLVLKGGVVEGCNMEVSFSFDNFEKVTEQPEEEKVEVQEQLTPESKVTIEGKRYRLVRDFPEISEVEVGEFIKILSGKENVDYGDDGESLEAGDILKVEDIDEGCVGAALKCIKLTGEGSYNSGYIYNRALEDNFEIVEVEVIVKEK